MVLLHVAALIAAVWSWRRRSDAQEGVKGKWTQAPLDIAADWMPLLLVPFLYAELPALMSGLGGSTGAGVVYHDALVQGWEGRLFGGQPSRTLAGVLPYEWLSELLHAGYLSYYAIIYGPPLWLYASGRRGSFNACLTALMLAFTSCFLVFALFPVQGPRYVWPSPAGVPDGFVRGIVLSILQGGSSRGTAFPSSHAAVSVAQALMVWRTCRGKLRVIIAIATGLLVLGAVYGGFHYAVDMLAGVLFGVTAARVTLMVSRLDDGEPPKTPT